MSNYASLSIGTLVNPEDVEDYISRGYEVDGDPHTLTGALMQPMVLHRLISITNEQLSQFEEIPELD